MNIIFFLSYATKKFWIAKKNSGLWLEISIVHKDNIIHLLYDLKKFRITQQFSDSNSYLASGVISLWKNGCLGVFLTQCNRGSAN